MLCEICHKNPAVVHYSQIINGEATEMHLCESCAKEKGIFPFSSVPHIGELLSGFIEHIEHKEKIEEKIKEEKCPHCGLTSREFKKTGLLGCSECYTTFKKMLHSLLRRIHGATHHIGKIPVSKMKSAGIETKIRKLQKELKKAVEEERYEDAARIRDEIKKLEQI
jgi:protein arginine kinase activator